MTVIDSPLFGRNLKYSKTKEQVQVAMQDFGKSETERLREVVKEFGKKYPTFEEIQDDFPVMMVCTSTNHAQKVWYIALLCSNLKLLQCRGVDSQLPAPLNPQLPAPLNLIANKTSVGYEIDYGCEEQHDYKEDYNQLKELTNKAQGVVMKLPPWKKVLPRVKFFKYLALVHMKHNTADTANLFDLEFKEKKITLKLKEEHDYLMMTQMMTQYANSLYHVLCEFLGESSETKVLGSRLYKLGYQKYDININWLDCSSEALKKMKKGYSRKNNNGSNMNKDDKDGQKLDKDDEKAAETGSAGEIKGRSPIPRDCKKNKKTSYAEEKEDAKTEEEEEKKREQNLTDNKEDPNLTDKKEDLVGVAAAEAVAAQERHCATVRDNQTRQMKEEEEQERKLRREKKSGAAKTQVVDEATFTAATVAKFRSFDKKSENDDKYPFPIAGEQSDVSRSLACMTKEGKYIEKLWNNWSDSKSFVNLAVGKFDNSSDFWKYMHFLEKYVFDQGRFKKSKESWSKSKRSMTVDAAAQSKKGTTIRIDIGKRTPSKQSLAPVLPLVSPDSKIGEKKKQVLVYITQGKTDDHIATIVDQEILSVVARTSTLNRSLASLFPDQKAKMKIKWQMTGGIDSVFIKDARLFEMNEPATARSIKAEADKRAYLLLRRYNKKDKKDIRNAIWGEGTSMDTLKPKIWLNDKIVNDFYLAIAKRTTKKKLQCHCFESFFMTTLLSEGYNKVKRWSKVVPDGDIFALDKILLPINVDNQHWKCAVIFMKKKEIQIVDSLGGTNERYLEALFQYLQEEHLDKKKEALPDMDQWKLLSTPENAPQQKNGKLINNS